MPNPVLAGTIKMGADFLPALNCASPKSNHSLVGSISYTAYNPAIAGPTIVFTNTNHTVKVSSLQGCTISLVSKSSGKWYWEVTLDIATNNTIGIADSSVNTNGYVGDDVHGWGLYTNTSGYLNNNNSFTPLATSFTNGDVISCLLDLVAGTLTFLKNNTSILAVFSGLSGTFFAAVGNSDNTGQTTTNFGDSAFIYTPPAGYTGLY